MFPHELYGGVPIGDTVGNLGLSQVMFKSNLRAHLPTLQPLLRKRIEETFRAETKDGKAVNGLCYHPIPNIR